VSSGLPIRFAAIEQREWVASTEPMGFSFIKRSGPKWEPKVLDLYKELRPSLVGYLCLMGLTRDEAWDVIQESFLRLVAHLARGGDESSLRSWVFCVAHNLSVNLHRNFERRHDSSDSALAKVVGRKDPSPNPEEQALENEKKRKLREAIAKLPVQQRRCLLLRAQGLRYREIAEVLDVSVQTAGQLLQRAIVNLAGYQ
jgi:RNA polymerase sigma-70 factor, ECF subfamily